MIETRSFLRSWLLTSRSTPFGLYKFFSCKATPGTNVLDCSAEARTNKIRCNLSNPKPGHTTGGSCRGAQWGGEAGPGRTGRRQNSSSRTGVLRTFPGIENTSFERFFRSTNKRNPIFVESKTRTYHGRVGTERTARRRDGVGQNWTPTEQFAQETRIPRTLEGIEKILHELFSRSTNKRNPM